MRPATPFISRILFMVSALVALTLTMLSMPVAATASTTPSKLYGVVGIPGPKPGEITITWKQGGKNTTSFTLETALSLFSKSSSSSLPPVGRHPRVYTISAKARSYTMSAGQVAEAGAGLGSGMHLVFRLGAVNRTSKSTITRWYPYVRAAQPEFGFNRPRLDSTKPGNTTLQMATFNVRTARATTDARSWLQRRAAVAEQIKARHPAIVALQEIGPGRADGAKGSTKRSTRQTTSLLRSLEKIDADQYKMVRTTPYVAPHSRHSTQGARLLYDSNAVSLISKCPQVTGKSHYSASCSMELPIRIEDSEGSRRSAAYAKFADRRTRQQFFVVSVHLDSRHSDTAATEATYDALRGRQVDAVVSKIASLNPTGLPVLIAGDINSYQHLRVGNAPKERLAELGFIDSAAARSRTNMAYSTFNGFAVTQRRSGLGYGSRLDAIFVRGGSPVSFENVTNVTDSSRPSDHNMVLSTLILQR